jgi:ATP-dependent Lon protease
MQDKATIIGLQHRKYPAMSFPFCPCTMPALFPKMVLPLVVMKGESVHLIDEAMAKDRMIGLLVAEKTGRM